MPKKKTMTLPRWSAEELNTLTIRYGTMPLSDLQRLYLPTRTAKAISVKAVKAGLAGHNTAKPWTQQELDLLAQHRHLPVKQLRDTYFPNRTVCAVLNKKNKYTPGQTANETTAPPQTRRPWTQEELECLKKFYKTMPAKELQAKYFPDRTVRAVGQKAYLMTTLKTRMPVWTEDELRLLRENIGKIPVARMSETILPNRSRTAIETKITLLGLRNKTQTAPKKPEV